MMATKGASRKIKSQDTDMNIKSDSFIDYDHHQTSAERKSSHTTDRLVNQVKEQDKSDDEIHDMLVMARRLEESCTILSDAEDDDERSSSHEVPISTYMKDPMSPLRSVSMHAEFKHEHMSVYPISKSAMPNQKHRRYPRRSSDSDFSGVANRVNADRIIQEKFTRSESGAAFLRDRDRLQSDRREQFPRSENRIFQNYFGQQEQFSISESGVGFLRGFNVSTQNASGGPHKSKEYKPKRGSNMFDGHIEDQPAEFWGLDASYSNKSRQGIRDNQRHPGSFGVDHVVNNKKKQHYVRRQTLGSRPRVIGNHNQAVKSEEEEEGEFQSVAKLERQRQYFSMKHAPRCQKFHHELKVAKKRNEKKSTTLKHMQHISSIIEEVQSQQRSSKDTEISCPVDSSTSCEQELNINEKNRGHALERIHHIRSIVEEVRSSVRDSEVCYNGDSSVSCDRPVRRRSISSYISYRSNTSQYADDDRSSVTSSKQRRRPRMGTGLLRNLSEHSLDSSRHHISTSRSFEDDVSSCSSKSDSQYLVVDEDYDSNCNTVHVQSVAEAVKFLNENNKVEQVAAAVSLMSGKIRSKFSTHGV